MARKSKSILDKKLFRVVKAAEIKPEPVAVNSTLEHKVKNGESLSRIARKYRTTISSIVAANELKNTVVMAGQTVCPALRGSAKGSGDEIKDFKVVQGRSEVTRASWKMPVRGRLSDKYGWRNHPVYRKRLFHAGIDILPPRVLRSLLPVQAK